MSAMTVTMTIGLLAAMLPTRAGAEPLTECKLGQYVAYAGGSGGEIIGEHNGSCLVRSPDGRLQSWVAVGELTPAEPPKPAPRQRLAATEPMPTEAAEPQAAAAPAEAVTPIEVWGGLPLVGARPANHAKRELNHPKPRVAERKRLPNTRRLSPSTGSRPAIAMPGHGTPRYH